MRFLFRLDLSLHAGAGKKIWNFDFGNQTRPWAFNSTVARIIPEKRIFNAWSTKRSLFAKSFHGCV